MKIGAKVRRLKILLAVLKRAALFQLLLTPLLPAIVGDRAVAVVGAVAGALLLSPAARACRRFHEQPSGAAGEVKEKAEELAGLCTDQDGLQ